MNKLSFTVAVLVASVLGAVSIVSYQPLGYWLVLPLCLTVIFALIATATRPRDAFFIGGFFSFSFFLTGLWWIFKALSGHIGLPVPLAFILTVFMCIGLALLPAAAFALSQFLFPKPANTKRLFALAALWSLAEWIRGWLLTGFPWLLHGYTQIPHPILAGWAPVAGVLGVGLVLHLIIAATVTLWQASIPNKIKSAVFIAVLLATPSIVMNAWTWTAFSGKQSAAVLQGNVKQSLEWDPTTMEQSIADYLTTATATHAQLIVMPETALPYYIRELPVGYLEQLRQIAGRNSGSIITGIFLSDNASIGTSDKTYNGALTIQENTVSEYKKNHLAPYGEYYPMPDFLRTILNNNNIPFSDLTPGDKRNTSPLSEGYRTAISICYEIAFGNELREQSAAANLLVNLTNDAWFDTTFMPMQHLQIAQARALESGRWLVRAANTGISAVIDHNGNIVQQQPLKTRGVILQEIEMRTGATPYLILGDALTVVVCLVLLVALLITNAINLWRRRQL